MFNIRDVEREVIKQLETVYSEGNVRSIFLKHNFEDMMETPYHASRLLLKRIRFNGRKIIDGIHADEFTYDRNIFPGVNVWTGENLIGKSTILKIIKYCLTGRDSLKPDIKKWLKNAMLEYELNGDIYTMNIEFTGNRVNGDLSKSNIDQKINSIVEKENVEFTYLNRKDMEEKLEAFFMSRLGLYPLKWTQKNSSKDSTNLEESSTSWATYYKAIFLESDEYNSLLMPSEKSYGNQTQKILGMFLGVDLLKIQNRVSVRLEKIRYELATSKGSIQKETNDLTSLIDSLELEYMTVTAEKTTAEQEIEQYIALSRINEVMKELGEETIRLSQANRMSFSVEQELNQIIRVIDEEHSAEIGLKEALHFKLFFNGIKVDSCPHCETQISELKLRKEKELHICSICDEPLVEGTQEQQVFLLSQIEENRQVLIRLKAERKIIETNLAKQRANITLSESRLLTLNQELAEINQINISDLNQRLGDLLLKQGKIEGRLEEVRGRNNTIDEQLGVDLVLERDVLTSLLSNLQNYASVQNENLLRTFKESIKTWANNFGIKNIDDVIINERLEPQIIQSGEVTSFQSLTDGERLRLKIAFFIQLMMLAKDGIGKHPKLLIIDSPGASELIDKDFDEIISTFNKLNKQHAEECQILIASARKSVLKATDSHKIEVRESEETMF